MRLPRKFIICGAVLAALAVVAVGYGIWKLNDVDTVNNNQFTTGSALTVNMTASPTAVIWPAVVNAQPPAQAFGQLSITNGGPGAAWVSMTSTHTDATLAAGLRLRILHLGGGACSNLYEADGSTPTARPTDTQIYEGPLSTALFGSNALGLQAGDINFALGTRNYCFGVSLPASAPITLAGKTNSAAFIFESEPQ